MLPAKNADIWSRFIHTEPLVRSFNGYGLPDIRFPAPGLQYRVALDLGGEFNSSLARSSDHWASGSICAAQSYSNLSWPLRDSIAREPPNRRDTETVGRPGGVRRGGDCIPHRGPASISGRADCPSGAAIAPNFHSVLRARDSDGTVRFDLAAQRGAHRVDRAVRFVDRNRAAVDLRARHSILLGHEQNQTKVENRDRGNRHQASVHADAESCL